MKKILLTTVGLAALGIVPAVAADLPARTYTKAAPIVEPLPTWAGFYIGAMGGYAGQTDDGIKGGFAGGTAGYNWQQGNIVFGLEADAAWADINNSVSGAIFVPGVGFFTTTTSAKIQDWGTVRGRIGYAVGPTLLYATGGYAWADTKISLGIPGVFTASDSQVHSGYAVGGGVEYLFAPKWSVKAEYLYKSFSSKNYTFNVLGLSTTAASGSYDIHSAQVGVNYHF